ncbi:MAG: DUF1254 domain-containing protein [Gemmatimonadaceae bacterium]
MATEIPSAVTMPDSIETRLGELRFSDGFPDDVTVEKVYDNLDFQRGVQAFLSAMPAASLRAMREGIRKFGPDNRTVILFETLMDSRSLFLTATAETPYAMAWLNLKAGPVVVETPPNTVGVVDDFWFRYVSDFGASGPDRGKGGHYLFLPPDFHGDPPKGYFAYRSRTFGNWLLARCFPDKADPESAVRHVKERLKIYPLADAINPPPTNHVNVSGTAFNTVHSSDFSYFLELDQVVQEEPPDAMDSETLGFLAAIGLKKGEAFAPDDRMRLILSEAAHVASATARAIAYRSRSKDAYLYENSAWCSPVSSNHEFVDNGASQMDARTFYFFCSTGVTPTMTDQKVGQGAQSALAFVDSLGQPLSGSKTYRLRLPRDIPAEQLWSVAVYDTQTRSMLQTNQQFPSVSSRKFGLAINPDGSVDVYFGPKAPPGKSANWIQTCRGKGWAAILRLYKPREAWFSRTWRPGEIEEYAVRRKAKVRGRS